MKKRNGEKEKQKMVIMSKAVSRGSNLSTLFSQEMERKRSKKQEGNSRKVSGRRRTGL